MGTRARNSPSADGPDLDSVLQERLVAPPSADEPDLYAEVRARVETGDTPTASGKVPWDIGAAQPHVVALEKAGAFQGRVLDTGCGLGDNAIHLALAGHRVTAVDRSSTAVSQAGQRASAYGAHLEFRVADATRLDDLDGGYDTVLSSALYHSLPKDARSSYAVAVHRVSNPGARLHLLTFADDLPESYPLDSGITQKELRATFGGHWSVDRIESVYYDTSFTPATLGSVSTALTSRGESGAGSERSIHWRYSNEGHLQLRMWYLLATRNE